MLKKKDIEEVVKCFIISMYLNTIILLQYSIADATPGVLALMVMILSCFLVVGFFFFSQILFHSLLKKLGGFFLDARGVFSFSHINVKCMSILKAGPFL